MISIPQSEYVRQHFEAPYSPCTLAIVSSFNFPSIAFHCVCMCVGVDVHVRTSEHIQRSGLVETASCALMSIHIPVSQEVTLYILNDMKRAEERDICMN